MQITSNMRLSESFVLTFQTSFRLPCLHFTIGKLWGGDKAKQVLTDCPSKSLWFERFSKGRLSRMGQIIKQDRAVSLVLMHALCQDLDSEWNQADSLPLRSQVVPGP